MKYKFFIIIGTLLTLSGCCKTIQSNNSFIQTDYGTECISMAKTRDELLLCYVKANKLEHAQNLNTNNIILGKVK